MGRRLVLLLLVAAALGGAVSASAEPFRILYAEQIDLPVGGASDTAARKPQVAGQWPLRAYGREYDLHVEPNDSLVRRLPPASLAGKSVYRGTLNGIAGSWLRLTVAGNETYGAFWDGFDFYAIAPGRVVEPYLDSPLPTSARDATFVYRLSDTQGGIEHGFCGVGDPTGSRAAALNQYQNLVAELRSVAANNVLPLQIEVAVLGDFPLRQRFADPVAQVLATINIADGIFTSQLGVSIVPTDLQVFATAEEDPFLSTDGPTLLRELGDYRSASPVLRDRGLAHLMTGKDLDGTVAGIAFLGALCSPQFGVGLTEDWRDTSIAGLIMAHELGHNFGAPHDGEAGSACESVPRSFLMAPAINFSSTFSSCSLTQMQPHIQGASCVVPLQTADVLVEVPATVSALVGEPFDVPLEVRSIGDLAAQGTELRIGPAIGFSLLGADAEGGTCSSLGSSVICDFDPIASGESRHVVLHAVDSFFPGHGSAAVELRASNDRNLANNLASLDVESLSPADIELSLPAGVVGGRVGEPISFSFDVHAVGARTARNATAQIVLDSLQILSVTPSAGSCPINGVVVLCSFGDLPSGATRRVDVTVQASQVLGQVASIHARADNDFNDTNNQRGFPIDVRAVRDLGLTMPAGDGVFVADAPFEIVMVLRSTGVEASAAGAVTLTVTSTDLPTLDSVVAPGGTCTTGTDTITCAYASLAAGAERTITVRAHAPVGNYTFSTRVDTSADDVPTNNEGQFFASVRPAINVAIESTGGGSPFRLFVDGVTQAQARVRSFGALAASDVTVRAEIPPQFTIVNATLGGGSCARAGQVITCTRASLPRNVDALFDVSVQPTQPGNFQVDVTVDAPGDTSVTDNILPWFFEVSEGLDVGIELPAPTAVLFIGVPQTLSIVVRNGALPSNPGITVSAPGFAIIESATIAGGVCLPTGGSSFNCFPGNMAPRDVRQIELRVRATFMSNFAVTIQAFAGGFGFDVNPGNDIGVLTVTVTDRQGDAAVQLSGTSASGRLAERFAYPTVTVAATSAIDEARLLLTFDASITGIGAIHVEGGACTTAGAVTNITITCLLGTIESGTSRRINVELSGSRAGSFMSFVTLVARNDANLSNDTAQVSVSVSNPPPPPPPPPQSSGGGGGGGAIEAYWAAVLLMFVALALRRSRVRRMKASLPLAACFVLTCQIAAAAEQAPSRTPPMLVPPAPAPKWLTDANGCKFLRPAATSNQLAVTIEWDGACVAGFVDGPGVVMAGYLTYRGEFSRGSLVKGTAAGGGYTFEGTFADNAPNGDMVVRMPDGVTVKGKFDHGRIAPPRAEITWPNGTHYRGEVEPTFLHMHGEGVLEYSDGSVYEGQFKEDRVEGVGVMKRSNGEIRRGTFVDGRQQGNGSVLYANQSRYEGQLRADQPSGQGRLEWADGSFYEGAFVGGSYQGRGKLKYADGSIYEGEFLAGDLSGSGTLTYPDGARYEGQYLYGRRHGTGRFTRAPGQVEEGEWKGGVLSGKCRLATAEVVYEGECLEGKATGTGRLDDKPKNLVYEGQFLKDQFEGQGSLRAGDVAYEGMFKAGLMEGPGTLIVGKVTMRGDFKAGMLVRGTVNAADGRTYEIDLEKHEILEVHKDGTKRPIERLPADITI